MPAKNISRHGEDTPAAGQLRKAVLAYKAAALDAIEAGVWAVQSGEDPAPVVDAGMLNAGQMLATRVLVAADSLPPDQRHHPVTAALVADSRRFHDAPRGFLAG